MFLDTAVSNVAGFDDQDYSASWRRSSPELVFELIAEVLTGFVWLAGDFHKLTSVCKQG